MLRILATSAASIALVAGLSTSAFANDPGTLVNACFKFQNMPIADGSKSVAYTVEFDTAGWGSFDSHGSTSATAKFSHEDTPDLDVHCAKLHYYECSDSSCDLTLTYKTSVPAGKTPQSTYSGSITLTWWSDDDKNHVSGGKASSDDIVVCGSNIVCSGQSYTWSQGNVGDMYVIFQPTGD